MITVVGEPRITGPLCYLCHKAIIDYADAELFNVKIEEMNLYHREIAHLACITKVSTEKREEKR